MKALLLAAMLLASAVRVDAACRQALMLGLDVSGSVDRHEYRLQMDGLAAALLDGEVQAAFLAMPQAPVRLAVFEWSGYYEQRLLINWTDVDSALQLNTIAATLQSTQKAHMNDLSTALGAAMHFGAEALMQQEGCWQRTLDLSGDGPANFGVHPRDVVLEPSHAITINGLVIGPEARANTTKNLANVKTLGEYYRSFVMRGPGAFVESADGFEDFARAMRRKLLREVSGFQLSGWSPPQ